jgi:hypothetical protein
MSQMPIPKTERVCCPVRATLILPRQGTWAQPVRSTLSSNDPQVDGHQHQLPSGHLRTLTDGTVALLHLPFATRLGIAHALVIRPCAMCARRIAAYANL